MTEHEALDEAIRSIDKQVRKAEKASDTELHGYLYRVLTALMQMKVARMEASSADG